ncbi:MAG TPA: hypothetical protein VGP43_02035 [Chitinophagaceae bacterium]|nr:hypothetical protein [Chitinophagaceae bacterium]
MESHQIHSHAKEKHFKHYLFEFFMLFFAVFAGFLAENIREHLVEKNREKAYIQSMISDMKSDIKQLDSLKASRLLKNEMIDSILLILDMPDPDLYGNQLYYFARWMPRPLRMITSDGTMQQLKNGNLRLIRSRRAVDALMEYDQLVRFGNISVEDREETLIQQFYPSLKKIFDARVFEKMVNGMLISRPIGNPKLLHVDKESLDELYSHIHFLKNVNSYSIQFTERRRKFAEHVLDVLNQEYNLNND